ncbi:MAG TPA: ADOP family duplicated permease [Thermoanaerobaculia bacterium]|nr:ADOP family duplicated permease [Thermoanaerobaculia bacterium]
MSSTAPSPRASPTARRYRRRPPGSEGEDPCCAPPSRTSPPPPVTSVAGRVPRWSPPERSLSGSAPARSSSASPTRCCCDRCRSRIRSGWSRCGTATARGARRCRRPTTPIIATARAPSLAPRPSPASVGLAGAGEPRQVTAQRVTQSFFDVLGVSPTLGRIVLPSEEGDDPGDDVVLSHALWVTAFGGDAGAVGRVVRIDGAPHTVAAVMPPGFDFPRGTDLWLALVFSPADLADQNRGNENLSMIARLAPGATLEGARAEVESIAAGVLERVPERADFLRRAGWGSDVEPLRSELLGGSRPLLGRLALAALLVLLVACVNVAHLQLNLASARAQEMELRTCLGAGRRRLLGQLFAESLVLGAAGGLAGIALAAIGARALPLWLPADLPRTAQISLDPRAIGVGVALALLVSLAVGLTPAWIALRTPGGVSRQSGLGARSPRALRRGLVASEVALAVLLLALSGLLLRGFERLSRVDPGFETESRLSFRIRLPAPSYPSREARLAFSDALLERLRALPEIEHAAAADRIPLEGREWTGTFHPEGFEPASGEPPPGAELNVATSDLFASLGVPLLAGRDFSSSDTPDTGRVLIVDEALRERYFPDGAVGRRITFAREPGAGDWYEVVGVVGHVRLRELDPNEQRPAPQIYLPVSQRAPGELAFVLHATVDPESLLPRVRAEVAALAPELPVYDVRTLEQVHRGALALARAQAGAIAAFALVAVLLAAVGIYGVLALSVSERTREIGLRMALGASAARVARQVLGEALALVTAGTVIGLVAARLLAGVLEGALYGIESSDATTFALVVASCALGAVFLALVPARRAARIDPMTALRV